VLITGAASSIGRLMALKIAALGGRMILWDVNGAALRKLSGELEGRGLAAKAYPCDLADRSAIAARPWG
jgi:NAD(P)-dependent dehydrogenase (short-subunit alcohol dehydrogenase family)